MNYTIRPARKTDEPFLWEMLYYAAHMDEDGVAPESARCNAHLRASNPARRLYERFGFTAVAQVTNRVGTRSQVMELRFR